MSRPRRDDDLERCGAVLREVHEADRYPVLWPAERVRWLGGRDSRAAWVAEERGRLLGQLSLHGTDETRVRPQWREAVAAPIDRLAVVSRFFVARTLAAVASVARC